MPTQRRFEANSLPEVLAKVQKEIGPDAKISSAQRVRTGGLLGFFQREKFEVLAEVAEPSGATATKPQPQVAVGTSLMDLAEQINATEGGTERAPAGASPQTKTDPQVSTESDSFAEVLSRIAYQSHLTSETAVELPTATPEPAQADASSATPPPLPGHLIDDRPTFLDKPPVTAGAPAGAPAIRTRITDSPLYALGLPVTYIPQDPEATKSTSAVQRSLTASLAALPKAPTIRPSRGSIIAVVGEREEAVELAGDLAEKWGRPKEEVVLASPGYRGKTAGVLRNVRSAEDSRRSWSRRNRPTIVAIESELGSRNTGWAEHILTALEPIATFGVADATRKAEDIAAWAESLGGVDALAVNHVEQTVSPASVLSTGIPVDRIDGRAATPAYWAAILADRLTVA